MNQILFDNWMMVEYQRRHDAAIEEAVLYRLAKKTTKGSTTPRRSLAGIMTIIGKRIAFFGQQIQDRLSDKPASGVTIGEKRSAKCDG